MSSEERLHDLMADIFYAPKCSLVAESGMLHCMHTQTDWINSPMPKKLTVSKNNTKTPKNALTHGLTSQIIHLVNRPKNLPTDV